MVIAKKLLFILQMKGVWIMKRNDLEELVGESMEDMGLVEHIEERECEFCVSDIVAIPFSTDGKFRVKKLKVIKKYTRDQLVKKINNAIGIKSDDN